MSERKGMILSVLRAAHGKDCSNGGISSQAIEVTLVGPGVPEIFEQSPERPTVVLLVQQSGYKYLAPAGTVDPGHVGWMSGGNYAWTYDSRLRELFEYPLPIHDRQEAR